MQILGLVTQAVLGIGIRANGSSVQIGKTLAAMPSPVTPSPANRRKASRPLRPKIAKQKAKAPLTGDELNEKFVVNQKY